MDFREAVRVIWPGEVSGVVARAVNLSSSGILVDAPTPTPCPVGSDVLCDVALPRGPRLLRGRVAHRRLLPSEKVGMGIEFVDLSPHEAAELRDVVDESEARPQRVKVRFRGTDHVVSARAVATDDGFRLATTLPFLEPDTEVDVLLSPDASVSARGRVARVALESAGGAPRLLIDVRVEDDGARTPVVESLLDAVPEHVWEPDEVGATVEPGAGAATELRAAELRRAELRRAELHAAEVHLAEVHAAERRAAALPPDDPPIPAEGETATVVSVGLERDTGGEGPIPVAADPDRTEILAFETPPSRWRALGGGMIAGTVAFLAFVAVIVVMKAAAPPPAPVRSIAPPVIATQSPPPAQAPSAQPPSAQPPSAQPPSAQPPSTQPSSSPSVAAEVIAASPANPTAAPFAAGVHASSPSGAAAEEPAPPLVPLTGSLAGAKRYPLSSPDGVAFNLPHAHTSMKLGTYSPAVRGLKSMWVRALPGGGTHLRFFYSSAASAPRLELERDGVRVTTR